MSQFPMTDHAPRRGFTLLEMLVVLTIMAVLTTVAAQSLEPVAQKSRAEATQRTLENLRSSLLTVTRSPTSTLVSGFLADMRRLPSSWSELFSVPQTLAPGEQWRGPYMLPPSSNSTTIRDSWDVEIRLISFPTHVELISNGPDRQFGTPAADEDNIEVTIPTSELSVSQLLVRLYGVDALGNAVDISTTEPKVTLSVPNANTNPQAVATEPESIGARTRVKRFSPEAGQFLLGTYDISVTEAAIPTGLDGVALNPTVRIDVLPGGTQTVEILIFRGTAASPAGTGSGEGSGSN
ncbi:MAG: prepilin-type N-terminal cleavage/methylation domain-containing protein [Planctomycetes bacterium]|nr:prepilin-type N-terminal cleavage/methylation domain-containing protein [Planctomycetota bacterium]